MRRVGLGMVATIGSLRFSLISAPALLEATDNIAKHSREVPSFAELVLDESAASSAEFRAHAVIHLTQFAGCRHCAGTRVDSFRAHRKGTTNGTR